MKRNLYNPGLTENHEQSQWLDRASRWQPAQKYSDCPS